MKGANRLSVIGHSMNFVHPNCMYRCTPIVYHWEKSIDIVTYITKTRLRLTDEQVSELLTLKRLFSLFPDGSFHQYLPIALSPLSWIRYRINKVNKVCPQLLLDKVHTIRMQKVHTRTYHRKPVSILHRYRHIHLLHSISINT